MGKFLTVFVPTVVIPLFVFAANWAWRHKAGYTQTASADFLLALLIFDGAVISAAEVFAPFVRTPELRDVVINWHIFVAAVTALCWYLVVRFGEPAYESRRIAGESGAPLVGCWSGALLVIALHIGFFVSDGG